MIAGLADLDALEAKWEAGTLTEAEHAKLVALAEAVRR